METSISVRPKSIERRCQGLVHYGTGRKQRSTQCSRTGYREVAGKPYCWHHAETARAEFAIAALKRIAERVTNNAAATAAQALIDLGEDRR